MHGAKDFSYFLSWLWGQDVHLDQGDTSGPFLPEDPENLQRIFQEARDRGGSWWELDELDELDGCPDFLSY